MHTAPLAIRGTVLQGGTVNMRISTYTHSMLGKPRHREDCDSVYSPGKGASQQACEHDTHSVPDHTRHRDNNESVYSAEKQHSQQAYELHMHTAPLAIRGTVLQGGTANMCMSTYTHSIPGQPRHREDYDSVTSATKQEGQQACEHVYTQYPWPHKAQRRY